MDFKNELGSSESCSQLSDKRFNSTSITNLKNIENENKLTFKHQMVRAELQSGYYETYPKQVINNKDEHNPIQNQFNSHCFKEHDMVRAELQCEDPLFFNIDFVSRPDFKNDYELGNSERNSNHVTRMTDEMAVHSENTKDKCPKSIAAFLKYQDTESSVSSRNFSRNVSRDSFADVPSNNDIIGIHKDGLHLKVCNHTDILEKENNDHVISLHETKKKEEENKESSSGIRKDCPPISNSEDNRALKSHPQQPTVDAENKEYNNSGNFLRRKLMPKYQDYEPLQSRINSFAGWPSYLDQTPQIMAAAGFFFIGINDFTCCFHCNGCLRNWEPGDDPWIKHARWYPECAYVLDRKGQKFINAVQSKVEQLASNNAGRSESSSITNISSTIRCGTAIKFDSSQESGSQSGQQKTTTEPALLLPDEGRESRPQRQSYSAAMVEVTETRRFYTVSEDNNPLPIPTGIPRPTTTESNQSNGHSQLERTSFSLHRRLNISDPLQSAVNMTLSCPSFGNHGQDTKAAKSTSSLPQL